MFTVYALHDPRDLSIRYVGCIGARPQYVRSRVCGHIGAARANKTPPVSAWIRELLALDLVPAFSILESGGGAAHEAGSEAERRHILRLRADGVALTNVRAGGVGRPQRRTVRPFQPRSEEQRATWLAAIAKRKRGAIVCLNPEAR